MVKKKAAIRWKYTTNGKPTTLAEIRKEADEALLTEALGEYITSLEARRRANIRSSELARWRASGKIRAKKMGSRWFYSRQDLINVIRSS